MRELLSVATQKRIKDLALEYWIEAVKQEVFTGIASGKEIGHRIADHVDDETTALLERHFATVRQTRVGGGDMPRSMGDVWVFEDGTYHPINIKSGEAGKKGQPNMVSLKKLLAALARGYIDSYYLLIIKVRIGSPGDIQVVVYLVDMLDYLEFVVFDSGPGQIMLREQQFYDAVDSGYVPPPRTLQEKIEILYSMLEAADERLIRNREAKRLSIKELVDAFIKNPQDLDQAPLNLKEFPRGED